MRCSVEQCADAMGIDVGHMSYPRLAQSIPPDYNRLRYAQCCAAIARDRFGVPFISFDEMRRRPAWAKREIARWLRGAGDAEPAAALEWQGRAAAPERAEAPRTAPAGAGCDGERTFTDEELVFRELFYSYVGGFDQQRVDGEVKAGWLDELLPNRRLDRLEADALTGHNTYLDVPRPELEAAWPAIEAALAAPATSVVVRVDRDAAERWRERGFSPPDVPASYWRGGVPSPGLASRPALVAGGRLWASRESRLDHSEAREYMDWRDQTGWKPDALEKAAATYRPLPHAPEAWAHAARAGSGDLGAAEMARYPVMREEVRLAMTEGVSVSTEAELGRYEVAQYPFSSLQAESQCGREVDRALLAGHLEPVPLSEYDQVRCVHPWTIVDQGGGKHRACQSYDVGLNRVTRTAPFALPSAWDVGRLLGPDSHFVKHDLRDGFWGVRINRASRNHFVLRHPITGMLVRCTSLPFGWADSPRIFCAVTETIAAMVRRRCAGRGVHILAYVDDFLIVGDSEEAARYGGAVFEAVCQEMGLEWAPHKARGPCRCIEFLGLLICNFPGRRCIALTEARQQRLQGMITDWLSRRRLDGRPAEAEPVELARLLGHMVFASQVIPGGRTYMQGTLSQFQGLEVDWRRGKVRVATPAPERRRRPGPTPHSPWRQIELSADFFRDLEWWSAMLARRNCTDLDRRPRAIAAITGTDASDWGTGQLAWLDGQRAEVQLQFSPVEQAWSINARELLGILRVVQFYGEQLQGSAVLVEGDNTAAIGAAQNQASTAVSMQETLRRLLETAERWDIELRFVHTPGVLLHRPDQTSRGDPIEEPRVRLAAAEFAAIERLTGRFTEFVGAERRHAAAEVGAQHKCPGGGSPQSPGGEDGCFSGGLAATVAGGKPPPHLWVHPTHSTVGSALRRVGERLSEAGGQRISGVVVVPDAPNAGWSRLLRHFSILGRYAVDDGPQTRGEGVVEMQQMGRFVSCRVRRPTLILSFPRASGATPALLPCGRPQVMMAGSFLWSPPGPKAKSTERGNLVQVASTFDPSAVEPDRGGWPIAVAELLGVRGKLRTFELLDGSARGGCSYYDGSTRSPWEYNSSDLANYWLVNDFVTREDPSGAGVVGRFSFDWKAAVQQLERWRAQSATGGATPPTDGDATLAEAIGGLRVDEGGNSPDDALKLARASADEAAAARRRVVPNAAPAASSKDREPSVSGAVQHCQSRGMTYAGCGVVFGLGARIEPRGAGFVHAGRDECGRAADEKAPAVVESVSRREASLETVLGAGRVETALKCLQGGCSATGDKYICGRCGSYGLHRECAGLSKYQVEPGQLVCAVCRAEAMTPDGHSPTDLVLRRAARTMLAELGTKASSTSKNHAEFTRLEEVWATSMGGGVVLPRYRVESMLEFINWLAMDSGRARSFETILRAAGGVIAKTTANGIMSDPRVKALRARMVSLIGELAQPCTHTTRKLARLVLDETLKTCCTGAKAEAVYSSHRVMFLLEVMMGLRLGETTGRQHGVAACDVWIVNPLSERCAEMGTTVAAHLESTKTAQGKGRWAHCVGTSLTSEFSLESAVRDLWRVQGHSTETVTVDGFKVERPDYSVVQLRVGASLPDGAFDTFVGALGRLPSDHPLRPAAKYLGRTATLKRKAATIEEGDRYVNLVGGAKGSARLRAASEWLAGLGLTQYAAVVKGPLIRATDGGRLTDTPLETGSSYSHSTKALKLAYELLRERDEEDLELAIEEDEAGNPIVKFAHHSNRRFSDKVARDTSDVTGATITDIDCIFGWNEQERERSMQQHYAGLDLASRIERLARVTMMV